MYDQFLKDTSFLILYTVVTVVALMASAYLLFRRGNAFAADIRTPLRLRRWTAVFFAVIAFGHLWYLPAAMLDSAEAVRLSLLIGSLLDCLLTIPLALIVMLCMLQDRRRPLWLVAVLMAPLVAGLVVCIFTFSETLLSWLYGYFLLMAVAFTIYMVRSVRQYGRWLRDNYADLENKEVWQSFFVLAFIILMVSYYVFGTVDKNHEYVVQVCGLMLICYILWRVETLSDLSTSLPSDSDAAIDVDMDVDVNHAAKETAASEDGEDKPQLSIRNNIGPLLRQYCEEPQLYLQYDISLTQLATLIGVNRSYLSKHFALQGITYNDYINGLRIQHFLNLYHETLATHRTATTQQLALQSGFRSYNTFSVAFKKIMGMNTTEWIRSVVG